MENNAFPGPSHATFSPQTSDVFLLKRVCFAVFLPMFCFLLVHFLPDGVVCRLFHGLFPRFFFYFKCKDFAIVLWISG